MKLPTVEDIQKKKVIFQELYGKQTVRAFYSLLDAGCPTYAQYLYNRYEFLSTPEATEALTEALKAVSNVAYMTVRTGRPTVEAAPAQSSAAAASNGNSRPTTSEGFTSKMLYQPSVDQTVVRFVILMLRHCQRHPELFALLAEPIHVTEEAPVIPATKPIAEVADTKEEPVAADPLWPFTRVNGRLVITPENSARAEEVLKVIRFALYQADQDAFGRPWKASEIQAAESEVLETPHEVLFETALQLARNDLNSIRPATTFWRLKSARDHVDAVLSSDPDNPEAKDLAVTIDRRYLSAAQSALAERRYMSALAILSRVRTQNEGVRIQHSIILKDAETGIAAQEAKTRESNRIKENDRAFAEVLRCMISDPQQPRQQQATNALSLIEAIVSRLQQGDPNYDQVMRYKDYLTRTVKNTGLDLVTIHYVPGTAVRKNVELPDPYHAYTSLHREHRYRWERKAEKREQDASQTDIEQYVKQLKAEGLRRAKLMGRDVPDPKPVDETPKVEPKVAALEVSAPNQDAVISKPDVAVEPLEVRLARDIYSAREKAQDVQEALTDGNKPYSYQCATLKLGEAWDILEAVREVSPEHPKLQAAKRYLHRVHLEIVDEFYKKGAYNAALTVLSSHQSQQDVAVVDLRNEILAAKLLHSSKEALSA